MSDSYENSSLAWDDQSWALLESAIERIEASWRQGETPELVEVVPVDREDRRYWPMLARLIIVDQECRSIAGCPQPLDTYLREYPELMGKPELFDVPEDSQAQQIDANKETVFWKEPEHESPGLIAEGEAWALRVLCPKCRTHIQVANEILPDELCCPECEHRFNLLQGGPPVEEAEGGGLRLKRMIAHFQLLEQLGMGAFGSVWKARDTDLDRMVALKIPRGDHLSPEEIERFFREARAAAQFRHPNLVGVQAVGREGNQLYIVSDFIEGLPLDAWRGEQQLEFRQTVELVHKIASAIQVAHDGGVIHRDLKPQNILIDSDDEPCIVDFGMAKRHLEADLTSEGQTLGTPLYMSPEQASGGSKDVDRRSDVYAMGIILYELLTGTTPFKGSTLEVCRQHLESEPPSPRKINGQIPRDLETICLQCLEKEPDRRYQTAQELADELKRYLDGEPIKARPSSVLNRAWRWSKRRPLIASLSGALLFAMIVICVLLIVQPPPPPPSPILVDDQFSESELNRELWDWGQADFSFPGTRGRSYSVLQKDGQLKITAKTSRSGNSSVQDVWIDLKRDLKEFNQDLVVDVDLAARGEIGYAGIHISDGTRPHSWLDPDSVVLFAVRGKHNPPLRLDRRFLRVYVCQSESLAILQTLSQGVEILDLSQLDKWLLRFYVSATSSGNLPADEVTLDVDGVRVSCLRGESGLVGRVIDSVTNRGVGNIDLQIGSDKQTVSTNANGYFFFKTSPGEARVRVPSHEYAQITDGNVRIEQDSLAWLRIDVQRTFTGYGDVEMAIPFQHDYVNGLAVENECLYVSAPEKGRNTRNGLYRIRTDGSSKTRVASLPTAFSLAMMDDRLLGVAWWPGRIYEIAHGGKATQIERLQMDWPRGMAFDGTRMWIVEKPEMGEHFVHAINGVSWKSEAKLAAPEPLAGAIAAAPDHRIWVCARSGKVYELDASGRTVPSDLAFPKTPSFSGHYDQLSFGEGALWGVDNQAKRLCRINVSDRGTITHSQRDTE